MHNSNAIYYNAYAVPTVIDVYIVLILLLIIMIIIHLLIYCFKRYLKALYMVKKTITTKDNY